MERLEPARYLRPAVKTYTPTRFHFVAIDYDSVIDHNDVTMLSPREWCILSARRRKDEWDDPQITTGTSSRDLWDTIISIGSNGPRMYIVAEDGADALTALDFWARVDDGTFSLHPPQSTPTNVNDRATKPQRPLPLILGDSCDIIGFRWRQGSARWIHPKNHDLSEWERIGQELRQRDDGTPPTLTTRAHTDEELPVAERADLLYRCYCRLSEWWTTLECGPWSDTLSGLGYSWWRRTLPKRTVLVHDNDQAHEAECQAVYGARMQSMYHGRVIDPTVSQRRKPGEPRPMKDATIHSRLYQIDTRAMYTAIMQRERFPVRVAGHFGAINIDRLNALCRSMDVIAHVNVKSIRGAIPYRVGAGTCYPRGEWWCWLTTPELLACIDAGELLECREGWRYHSGHPMRAYAEEVLRARALTTMTADPIGAILGKGTANALTGRLARRRERWVPDDTAECRRRWGWWAVSPGPHAPAVKYRGVCGRVFRWDCDKRRIAGLTAIYAHITAYGRCLAAEILDTAGKCGCVSWDTDGGWFTQSGHDALVAAGQIGEDSPGMLRLVSTAERGTWRTPKHHWIDGRYTLSGVPGGFAVGPTGIVDYHSWLNPARQIIDPTRIGIGLRHVQTHFTSYHGDVPVLASGWAAPLVVAGGVVAAPDASILDIFA